MSPTDDKIKFLLDDSDGSFGDLVGDGVKPLAANVSSHIVPTKEITPGIIERRKAAQREVVSDVNELDTASVIEPVEPLAYLEYQRPGVQHGVYKNLRLGKYEIQSRLDLHRHTVEQAREPCGGLSMTVINIASGVRLSLMEKEKVGKNPQS